MRNSMNCCCSPNMGRRDADKPVTPPLHQTVTTLVVGTCTKLLLGLWAWRPRLVNPHCGAGGRPHRALGLACEGKRMAVWEALQPEVDGPFLTTPSPRTTS